MTPGAGLVWGPFTIPISQGTAHFLATGTTGSGKTTLIDILMRSVFSSTGAGKRALIYDPKQEAVRKLTGLGLEDRVRILHPFDSRCSPWDLATDIADPLSARQFAQILIPESAGRSNDAGFFEDAGRDIISVTVQALGACTPSGKWTFRDLLLALLYEDNLQKLLAIEKTRLDTPFLASKRIWTSYFDPKTTDDRTRGNIRSTLNARLSVYEPVAAAWHAATRPAFSFKTWQQGNGREILILGNDEASRAAIDPINRAMFQRAAELTLARPEGQDSQTWFFLDEVREAGRLNSLNSLLLKGRSKGACVVLSFQDIDGLREVYGDRLANEIVANCNNVALLRTSSASTAQWAADMFGKFFVIEKDRTQGISGAEISSSETHRLSERAAVPSGEFLYLPLPTKESGLVGFFRDARASRDESKRYTLAWPALDQHRIQERGQNFFPADLTKLVLEPWNAGDHARLGISSGPTFTPTPPASQTPRPTSTPIQTPTLGGGPPPNAVPSPPKPEPPRQPEPSRPSLDDAKRPRN